jgi:uncharacterized membrane protein HdeD (DUF308 family)
MAVSETVRKRLAWATGLRALLMLLFGIYCVIWPTQALTTLVIVGGVVLLVAGVLGLWGLTFGGAKSPTYWWDVLRSALAIIVGVLILISPLMATVLTTSFLLILIGLEAIVFGVIEIYFVYRERDSYARIWPAVLEGVLSILFGLVLVFFPLLSVIVGVIWLGFLMILFAIGLGMFAWRLYRGAQTSPA